MLILYRLLTWLAAPLAIAHLAIRQRGQLRLRERLGGVPYQQGCPVWIHAASVGEVRLALRLWRELALSDVPVFLTSTTAAGLSLAQQESGGALPLSACPLDLAPSVRRTFNRIRPRALVLIETELWPGFLAEAERGGIPVLIANARLSDASLHRLRLLKALLGSLLTRVTVAAQDEENARRYRALGASPHGIQVTGNMKYDLLTPSGLGSFREMLSAWLPQESVPLWVAGSVREGEEALVLEAHRTLRESLPSARMILAPRHLNRVPFIRDLAGGMGLNFALRSAPPNPEWDVLILDTIGELLGAYATSHVAFVGGSLVPLGGQNLLEPALVGKPVLFGPSTENFRIEAQRLEAAGGGIRVPDAPHLAKELANLLTHPDLQHTMGAKAEGVVAAHRGATTRNASLITSCFRAS